ncbi:MAG TPA: hypothetical protein VF559_09815 [Caulobacteraceae bacterium]
MSLETAPASASTRRCRSPGTWARAEADYRAGVTAREVCERYDLGLTALRDRARAEGWRRADQPDPEPAGPDLALIAAFADLPAREGAEEAWGRMMWAIRQGRTREAQGWLKLHQQLSSIQIAEECFGSPADGRRALAERDDRSLLHQRAARSREAAAESTEPDSPDSPDSFSSPEAGAGASEPPPPSNRAARRRAEALARGRR